MIILKHYGVVLKNDLLLHINTHQTPYSFRHLGAIEIFKRTGSLTKLHKSMGYSSVNVSLTYLIGLEVADLNEGDMTMI